MRERSHVKSAAPLFAALGDVARLRIVRRLTRGEELSIAGLTDGSGITRQAVTKHLGVMRRAGLVTCTRRGRESLWALHKPRFEEARQYLDLISKQWDDALDRLRDFVEK